MNPRPFLTATLLSILCSAQIVAQDVTVTPLSWVEAKDAPDELPAFKTRPHIEFPVELRSTAEIGYVVVVKTIDEKGRVLATADAGTQPVLLRIVTEDWIWKFTAARREGKNVNSAISFAVIFNPASAAEKNPEATPRLLEVGLVQLPAPAGAKSSANFPDQVVYANVTVDPTGNITAVKNAPPGLEEKMIIAAKNWRFSPARHAGLPVAADINVPFVIVTGNKNGGPEGKASPPRATFQTDPVYPYAMRESGKKGEVLVDFVVDIEGRVRNAVVARSLNPAFDDPALEAVKKWRFEPGRIGDRPVNTHMQVPMIFRLNGETAGGEGPLAHRSRPDLSKLPEAFRYDTPPHLIGTARSVYPYALLRDGKTGNATVAYVVGTTGRVQEVLVKQATSPEFGRALAAALEQFTFEPAIKAGRPSLAMQGFQQDFSRDERFQLVSDDDVALLRREQKKPESIVTLRELDAKLVPVSRRAPLFPPSAPEGVNQGKALVEFLVDEEGHARLPRIVSATDDAFGYAAVQSIASWRFEPPKRGGKSVVVRVQAPVEFKMTEPASTK